MRVLVLSITAGQGHNTTALALCDYLKELGADSRMLDTYNYLNKILGDTVSKGYLLSVEGMKYAYSKVYRHLEKRKKNANRLSATRIGNMLFTNKMKKYIDLYDPDVIICTHIFSGIIIDILKQREKLRAKTIGIVTDFTFHPYWEESLHFDYVVMANENMRAQAVKKGFMDCQILPYGIPINPKFSVMLNKEEARAKLGLDTRKKTLLLMSGSMGYGNIESVVGQLDKIPLDFQLITVCGNNAEAKIKVDRIRETAEKPILNYGYTENVDILMDAADCIITKPGGLTTSEALAKRLPMIVVNPIPGHERRNVEFLLNSGAAMTISDNCPLDELVFELLGSPEKLEIMRRSIDLIRKPNATRDICEFVMKLGNNTTDWSSEKA